MPVKRTNPEWFSRLTKMSVPEMVALSDLQIETKTDVDLGQRSLEQIVFKFIGPASVLPSTTNSKLLFTNKHTGRAQFIRNPAYQRRLQAMRTLLEAAAPKMIQPGNLPIATNSDDRWFVFIVMPEFCNRMDPSNGVKAACDLLQEAGIVKNDKHVDAISVHAASVGLDTNCLQISLTKMKSDRGRGILKFLQGII